jgi:6-pyruvoyltetrahydropterin/6-carboxytetrahydropterin synthase
MVNGPVGETTGWVVDFADLKQAIGPLHQQLDHHYLNEIEGLEVPTLEAIARWIWDRLKPSVPKLHRIVIRRGSYGEGCVYQEDL